MPRAELTDWFTQLREPMRRWLSQRFEVRGADLDDVAQEVFLRLMRYSDDTLIEHPQTYLLRIAGNVINEWRERHRLCRPHEAAWLDDLTIDDDHEPEHQAENESEAQLVRAAVGRLPRRQQTIVIMHAQHDLTHKQIARQLGLTQRIVKRDLERGYATLREELKL